MPKRRTMLFGLLAVVAVSGWLLYARALHNRGPLYNERYLCEWVSLLSCPHQDDNPEQAVGAIRHIGTEAVPFLVRWIRYTKPNPDPRLDAFVDWIKENLLVDLRPGTAETLAIGATEAFTILGPQASNAIPDLTRLINDPEKRPIAWRTTYALAHLGEAALPPLLAAFTNTHSPAHDWAAGNIRLLGTNTLPAAPVFLHSLNAEDREMAETSAIVLSRLCFKPQVVIPLLTANLQHSRSDLRRNAVSALGRYGRQANSALPALSKILDDADPVMRRATTNALRKIAPEALTNAPPK